MAEENNKRINYIFTLQSNPYYIAKIPDEELTDELIRISLRNSRGISIDCISFNKRKEYYKTALALGGDDVLRVLSLYEISILIEEGYKSSYFKSMRFQKFSSMAKAYHLKHPQLPFYLQEKCNVMDAIPLMIEIDKVIPYERKVRNNYNWINLFAYCDKKYLIDNVIPYLKDHVKWGLQRKNFNYLYSNYRNRRLAKGTRSKGYERRYLLGSMIFEDCLEYLKSLSKSKRKRCMELFKLYFGALAELSEVDLEIIEFFPELKLALL